MSTELKQLLKAARDCGISKGMLCSMMNVGRRTLYFWCDGGNISNEGLELVVNTTKKLQAAHNAGKLPVNNTKVVLQQIINILSEIDYD